MSDQAAQNKSANAWLVLDPGPHNCEFPYPQFALELAGNLGLYAAASEGDWVVAADTSGRVTRLARVLRIRSNLKTTSLYFDRLPMVNTGLTLAAAGLALPKAGSMTRLQWNDFTAALPNLTGGTVDDVPIIGDQAYIRELLQLAVMDDLLGPANGPHEQILDMGVRDRYLVGKLAPREAEDGGIEGLEGPLAVEAEEEPKDLEIHQGLHEPGAEFGTTRGRVDGEADSADEIDASSNQSLIPSSFGMTFCVDGDVKQIEVEAVWGQYVRVYDHEHTKTVNRKIKDADGNVIRVEEASVKVKVWQRIPCGGKLTIDLVEGVVSHRAPDEEHPEVRVQGAIRDKNANGDRLVTLFLVNVQEEPEENKDSAWVFQPELIVRAAAGSTDKAIFRRRVVSIAKNDDEERKALEMIYRKEVEFAVGHGVAVHAKTVAGNAERTLEVRTVVMPQFEVPVTETPGIRLEDRSAMRELVDKGQLDMEVLAAMDRSELVAVLSLLASDYGRWIAEQKGRIGVDLVGHDSSAIAALDRCKSVEKRLGEGIAVLADPNNKNA